MDWLTPEQERVLRTVLVLHERATARHCSCGHYEALALIHADHVIDVLRDSLEIAGQEL